VHRKRIVLAVFSATLSSTSTHDGRAGVGPPSTAPAGQSWLGPPEYSPPITPSFDPSPRDEPSPVAWKHAYCVVFRGSMWTWAPDQQLDDDPDDIVPIWSPFEIAPAACAPARCR
jgi:hypothetical protein